MSSSYPAKLFLFLRDCGSVNCVLQHDCLHGLRLLELDRICSAQRVFFSFFRYVFGYSFVISVICLERGADCLHMVQLTPLPSKHHHLLPHLIPDLFLPFWYWLTQVVLEKRPLNRFSSSSGNLGTTAKQVAMVRAYVAKRR